MNVLFTWLGFRDLNLVGKVGRAGDKFKKALAEEKKDCPTGSPTSTDSPIWKIVHEYRDGKKCRFDRIYIFFDLKRKELGEGIKNFYMPDYCGSVEIIPIQSSSSHSYSRLFEATVGEWRKIQAAGVGDIEPYFNLSSGTTSMSALFVVLGQVFYRRKAKFIQVEDERVSEFNIDFDLASYMTSETLRQTNQLALDSIKGKSPEIRKVKKLVEKAARTDFNVLIYGETGTGKELLARAIHEASDRREKQFRPVNCATLPPQLAESLLFGHTADAYTGAKKAATGWFEELDGGTIFLDEIEACPPEVQAKLLRALQPPEGSKITCRRFSPLGATKAEEEKESDVRIIAATNERLAETGFRSDLLNRLAALTIPIPPLRERRGDIKLLAEHILDKIRETLGEAFSQKHFDESTINFIESREWRGNVRELQNAITQAAVFGEGDVISADDFDRNMPEFSDSGASVPGEDPDMLDLSKPIDVKAVLVKHDLELKKRYVDAALEKTGGHKNRAAELLGVPYQTIDNWQKAWKKLAAKEKP